MIAIWGTDYDFREDKCYKRPCCPKCEAPIGKQEDGLYHCFNCGEVVDVEDENMKDWLEMMEETKIEYEDCPKIITKDGRHLSGCGGEKCMETHYIRNPCTHEWEAAWGECYVCHTRFIV